MSYLRKFKMRSQTLARALAAIAAGLSFTAGAANAATYMFQDYFTGSASKTYVINVHIDSIYLISAVNYKTFVGEGYGYDVNSWSEQLDCNTPVCSKTQVHGDLQSTYANDVLTVHVQNRLPTEFFNCLDGYVTGRCGLEVQPSWVSFYIEYTGEIGDMAITTGAVPEPATWAMMIAGFGLVGATLRRRRPALAA